MYFVVCCQNASERTIKIVKTPVLTKLWIFTEVTFYKIHILLNEAQQQSIIQIFQTETEWSIP
jgi:hypothetical protein